MWWTSRRTTRTSRCRSLVSSNGYGIFWNNTSRSRFNNRFANYLYLSSEVADTIDYYFIYGPDFDRVVAGYRELTGRRAALRQVGLRLLAVQEPLRSQAELLGVANKYRDLQIPVDNIVQDWFWWNRKGEHVFNSNYPDPKGMVDELHRTNFHLMISVWPFFEPGSAPSTQEMDKRGWFVDKFKYREAAITLTPWPCTTPPTPKPESTTGASWTRGSSSSAWTRGGWTPPSPRRKDRRTTSRSDTKWPWAAAIAT